MQSYFNYSIRRDGDKFYILCDNGSTVPIAWSTFTYLTELFVDDKYEYTRKCSEIVNNHFEQKRKKEKKNMHHFNFGKEKNGRCYIDALDDGISFYISLYTYSLMQKYLNEGNLTQLQSLCEDEYDNFLFGTAADGDRMFVTIKKVIFNAPATIVYWADGTKTVVKCSENDRFDKEKGLTMAILKKKIGDDYYKQMKKWTGQSDEKEKKEEKTITVDAPQANTVTTGSRVDTIQDSFDTFVNKCVEAHDVMCKIFSDYKKED